MPAEKCRKYGQFSCSILYDVKLTAVYPLVILRNELIIYRRWMEVVNGAGPIESLGQRLKTRANGRFVEVVQEFFQWMVISYR